MNVTFLEPTERFQRDLKKVPADVRPAIEQALRALMQNPTPQRIRHHTLSGFKPKIHCIDVTSNHAYQITFTVEGQVARLLRIGTHKQITHDPRG